MVPWFWAVHARHALFIGVASSSGAHPNGGFEGLFDALRPALLRHRKCHGGFGQDRAGSEERRKRSRCSFFFLLLLSGDDSHGISMKPIFKYFQWTKASRIKILVRIKDSFQIFSPVN